MHWDPLIKMVMRLYINHRKKISFFIVGCISMHAYDAYININQIHMYILFFRSINYWKVRKSCGGYKEQK